MRLTPGGTRPPVRSRLERAVGGMTFRMQERDSPRSTTIRRASREDAETVLALIEALAEYEHLEPPDPEARARLIEHGFGSHPRFDSYLVEISGEAVGYAIVFE